MEVYMKQLLDNFTESDSSRIHIVDDNAMTSQPGSPTLRNRNRMKSSIRRYKSMHSFLLVDPNNNSDNNDNNNNNNNNRKLTSRMEKHRQSRWESSSLTSSATAIPPSCSPIEIPATTTNTTTPTTTHNNLGRRTTSVPNMLMEKPQRKASISLASPVDLLSVASSLAEVVLRKQQQEKHDGDGDGDGDGDSGSGSDVSGFFIEEDDEDIIVGQNNLPIQPVRISLPYINKRTSSSLSSARVVAVDSAVTLSHQLILATALTSSTIATSGTGNTCTKTAMTINSNNNYNKSRRNTPPLVPIRKFSVDEYSLSEMASQ